MRDLLILGVEVHAAEMAEIVERVNGARPTWRLRGFLAPEENDSGVRQNGYPVLGTIDQLSVYPDVILEDRVVVAGGVSLAGSVHVEADCYLGQACTVRQEVRIGRGSLIGMGAVVVNDVPPNSVIVGNPGRRLRDRAS